MLGRRSSHHKRKRHSHTKEESPISASLAEIRSGVVHSPENGDKKSDSWVWKHKWWVLLIGIFCIGAIVAYLRRRASHPNNNNAPPVAAVTPPPPAASGGGGNMMQRIMSILSGFMGQDAKVVSEVCTMAKDCKELSEMEKTVTAGTSSIMNANRLYDSIAAQLQVDAATTHEAVADLAPRSPSPTADANNTGDVIHVSGDRTETITTQPRTAAADPQQPDEEIITWIDKTEPTHVDDTQPTAPIIEDPVVQGSVHDSTLSEVMFIVPKTRKPPRKIKKPAGKGCR